MLSLAEKKSYYTYVDVLEWDEDVRAEIIDGELYMMAPPTRFHQDIIWELSRQFGNFLQGKPCKGYSAPFGVRLFPREDQSDDMFVEPDIVVVCDSSKLDDRGCNGAPDLVVEILSPSTARHDRVVKFRKYLEAGVREYWIVNPEEKIVQIHILDNGQYITKTYDETEEAPVTILPGCVIALPLVFGT
ncbi:MAG: Uma2 family endonuclease [Treponema sp.]|jgi:Uma2 family endonuclease|nr:Uma2 family endonuclease [Treponema sp.]